MGLFFNDYKPKISNEEFKKVRIALRTSRFTPAEVDRVESIFRGDLQESSDRERGIDKIELERGLKWMRENMSKHKFSEEKMKIIEEKMRRFF